jgi:2-C-methyl-D-erythritol 4-phosphate cytidylyltransferase
MLLLAAGRGSRFGGPVPKAYLQLGGRPLLVHAAERLLRAMPPDVATRVVLLVHPDDRDRYLAPHLADLRAMAPDLLVVDGGASRQQSMQNGLAACDADTDLVLIHDAARALVPIAASRDCVLAGARHGAALLAIPAADTMKRVHGDRVQRTVDREDIWLAQTPQVVRFELLRRAMAHAERTHFAGTDDVSLVEHLGEPAVVVPGSPTNLKITRPEDLPLAAAILAAGLA